MNDQELLAIIAAHRRDSLGYENSELSSDRAAAMDAYHGRPYGNEVEGRSQVVSRDIAETVDWALPSIMRAFTQSGSIGEFDPVGPEDEDQARQESDYTNQVIMKDNDGWMVIHDSVKDTLILRNGYTKHWWEEETTVRREEYTGLTLEELTKITSDLSAEGAEWEIVEQESKTIEIPGMPQLNPAQAIQTPPTIEVFDVELKIKRKEGRVHVEAVPPEELRVSKRCRGSLQKSPFTEHRPRGVTRSDLIEMGMDRKFVDGLPGYRATDNNQEALARDTVSDENNFTGSNVITDKSMDEMEYAEAYVRIDYDGDGVAELRKVVTVANQLPPGDEWNEEIEAVPMTSWIAKRVPHRHIGESLWDELADLQEIKTALHRQLLDNVYLTNNSEKVINDRANPKDFLVSMPGGIKRVRGEGPVQEAVMPLVNAPILDKVLPAIDYWDKVKEIRSGIRPGSDMDPDVLRETTKGAFLESLNRASQKIEMITRLLAESGLKELFLQVHDLLIRHQDQPRVVQMRGKWVSVNPQEWRNRTDLTVKVGLGTGNQEDQRQKLMMLAQGQGQLLQAVVSAPPQVYEKMYAMFAEIAKALNFEVPEQFAIAPGSPEYQQLQSMPKPPDPAVMKAQIDGQVTAQTEQMKAHYQAMIDQNRQEMLMQQHRDKLASEAQVNALKQQLEQQKTMNDAAFQRWREELNAAVKIEVANIMSSAKVQDAATAAATGEVASDVRPGL